MCFVAGAVAQGQRVGIAEMDPAYYCENRADNELFRKEMPADITEEDVSDDQCLLSSINHNECLFLFVNHN